MDRSLRYATSFDEKLLGVGCDVEIVVDTVSGDAYALIEMRSFLRSIPGFRISLDDLIAISDAIKSARPKLKLLDKLLEEATDHQLNFSAGGATLTVVHPQGKSPRFSLSIGSYHREGELDKMTAEEVTEAVTRVEALKSRVRAKVMSLKS